MLRDNILSTKPDLSNTLLDITSKCDANGLEIDRCLKVEQTSDPKGKYTANLYHTKSSILVNGRAPELFTGHLQSLLQSVSKEKLENDNTVIIDAIRYYMDSDQLSTELRPLGSITPNDSVVNDAVSSDTPMIPLFTPETGVTFHGI